MKRHHTKSLFFLVIFLISCSACGKSVVSIPHSIDIILTNNGIFSAEIISLDDFRTYRIDYDLLDEEDVYVSDDEIRAYIDMQLESYAELIKITDRDIVQHGDVAIVSYIVILNGKIINEIDQDILMVGKGNYDQQFENALVGKYVGIPFSEELISPDGEKMIFNITVESINKFKTYELTNEFVQQNMGIETVEKYYENCKKILQDEKLSVAKRKLEEAMLKKIIDKSKFELDKEEIARFSLQYVETEKQFAYVYGLDLEEYIEIILNEDREEFFQRCYEYGEDEIKKYLLIGGIFSELQYSITDDDIRFKCEQLGYEYNTILKDEYAKALVEYAVMEERVINYFVN